RPDCRGPWRRHRLHRGQVDAGRNVAELAQSRHHQTMAEGADTIDRPFAGDRAPALAEACEHRSIARQRVLESDLGVDIVLVRNQHAGLVYMLEADVLAPEPVAIT